MKEGRTGKCRTFAHIVPNSISAKHDDVQTLLRSKAIPSAIGERARVFEPADGGGEG
jgi:hypothetical protein